MAAVRSPRPDLVAYEHATRAEFPVAVKELEAILGAKLVAYIAGVTETRAVREWAEGTREAREPVPQRLRVALRLARMICDADGPEIAQAWFAGLNPQLDDRSPARLLREGELDTVGPLVLSAARAFVVGG